MAQSPADKSRTRRAEAELLLASTTPSASARDIYAAHGAGGAARAALAGAPSTNYENSIGAGRKAVGVVVPPLPTGADNAARNAEDRMGEALGATALAARLRACKPFEPTMLTCGAGRRGAVRALCARAPAHTRRAPLPPPLPRRRSGDEIRARATESTIFLRGPQGSPELKASAAAPRPVVAYQLKRAAPAPAMGAARGQAHIASHFTLKDMELGGPQVAHAVPPPSRVVTASAAAAADACMAAARDGRIGAAASRQAMLAGSLTFF
jgi:hypothetical protein